MDILKTTLIGFLRLILAIGIVVGIMYLGVLLGFPHLGLGIFLMLLFLTTCFALGNAD